MWIGGGARRKGSEAKVYVRVRGLGFGVRVRVSLQRKQNDHYCARPDTLPVYYLVTTQGPSTQAPARYRYALNPSREERAEVRTAGGRLDAGWRARQGRES